MLDGGDVEASGRCELSALVRESDWSFADVRVPVQSFGVPTSCEALYHRALLLLSCDDGSAILVDVFDVEAEAATTIDYVCRAGDPGPEAELAGLSTQPRGQSLFAHSWPTPPWDERTATGGESFGVLWPGDVPVGARFVSLCDEVITFRSPAWRAQADVFEDPGRAWTAITCRQRGSHARYVTVFVLGGKAPVVRQLDDDDSVALEIHRDTSRWRVHVGDGLARVEPLSR